MSIKSSIHFSELTNELIKQARLLAIELGHDYISASDFMLTDCIFNKGFTIKDFVFSTDMEFHKFYELQRKHEATLFADLSLESLSVTKDLEAMIVLSFEEMKIYGEKEIQPYHLFLASTKSKYPLFINVNNNETYANLIAYYQSRNVSLKKSKHTILERLRQKLGMS